MIVTFKNQATSDIAEGLSSRVSEKLLPKNLHKNAQIKMALINRAKTRLDLRAPGLRLERLKGNRKKQHSLRINIQYRICFKRRKEGVFNVEIVD